MDTSPRYIQMCQSADNLQSEWIPSHGHYVYVTPESTISMWDEHRVCDTVLLLHDYTGEYQVDVDAIARRPDTARKWFVWLPTQDQLQSMIDSSALMTQFTPHQYPWGIEFEFEQFVMNERYYNSGMYYTLEQLWLGFVLHEKYQQRWNGTGWEETQL